MSKKCSKSSKTETLGNTKPGSRSGCYRWCFTLNNYTENEKEELKNWCSKSSKIWILGYEHPDSTPHIQGYINLKDKQRLTGLKKINARAHWETCKGTEKQNLDYCSKEGNFDTNAKLPKPLRIIDKLYPWQLTMKNILLNEKNDRTIHWIYDEIGGNGKTQLLKYMVHHHKCLFTCGGKKNDIINLIFNNKNYMLTEDPATVIWNLPRDIDPKHISYESLEMIKDGLIANNKFECGSFICNSPNIVILSNILPLTHKLTNDRWKIWNIINKELIPYTNPLDIDS